MTRQPRPTLGQAAKTALEYRVRNGVPLDVSCDVYELIVRQGVELRLVEVKLLEGFYLSDRTAGQINFCSLRPLGLQEVDPAHELGRHDLKHRSAFDPRL